MHLFRKPTPPSISLFVPHDIRKGYACTRSQHDGEQDLIQLSKEQNKEYEWAYYPETTTWRFYPQYTSTHISRDRADFSCSKIGPYAEMYKKGNLLRYHLHPSAAAEEIERITLEQSDRLSAIGAHNLGNMLIQFPTVMDVDHTYKIREQGNPETAFAIAHPFGITRIDITSITRHLLKEYEHALQGTIIRPHLPTLDTLDNIDSLMNQLAEEFNNRFSGQLHLARN